jgi:putative MFS transporter
VIGGVVLHLPIFAMGRAAEARAIMERFGARLVAADPGEPDDRDPESRYGQLFRSPFGGLTFGVALFGIGWGLVNTVEPRKALEVQ